MTKVAMQLESKIEAIKHKPTILKKVIVYIAFMTKMYFYIYLLMDLCMCLH